ncbi:MAG: SMR family transporter [Thiobacillus sp.]|nr:SMR family transporter [Thiobacillus sp.]
MAQIALKHGMSSPSVQANLNAGLERVAPLIAANPFVWAGLTLYGVGALLWLGVLAQIDVSQAYPYVGIGFLLTMVFGVVLLGESVSAMRLVGTLLVVAGVVLVSRT